jgi:SAF domain
VFWLSRPPYLRWLAAAAILAAAVAWDLAGRRSEPFPFAARPIAPGELIGGDDVAWRDLPVGLMEVPDLAAATASRPIGSGEPITTGSVGGDTAIPAGWWAVPLALPAAAVPGTEVRIVVIEPAATVDGVVVATGDRDLLTVADAGLVAVPGEAAEAVARAAASGGVTVLLRP